MVKRKTSARKYKVSTYVKGKIRVATVIAANKVEARRKAAKRWGKAADVGHWSITRV